MFCDEANAEKTRAACETIPSVKVRWPTLVSPRLVKKVKAVMEQQCFRCEMPLYGVRSCVLSAWPPVVLVLYRRKISCREYARKGDYSKEFKQQKRVGSFSLEHRMGLLKLIN